MKLITDEHCTGYGQPGHPERPERISRTQQRLGDQDELPLTWVEAMPGDDSAILRSFFSGLTSRKILTPTQPGSRTSRATPGRRLAPRCRRCDSRAPEN